METRQHLASKKAPAKKDAKKETVKPASKPSAKPAPKPVAKAGKKSPASAAAPAPKAAAKPAAKPASKVEVKKVDAKKPEPKKPEPKKPDSKNVEAKKPEAAKPSNGKPANGKPANGKPANGKPADSKAPAAKSEAAKSSAAKTNSASAGKGTPAAKPDAKAPAAKAPAKSDAKPAKGGAGKGDKPDSLDAPYVPKKGPIDLAQHKSVAEAAAAVANARGGTGEFIIINGRRVRAISTKGISVAKKPKSAATEAAVAPSEQQIREIKTKLSKKELDEYKALLHAKRRQLVGMLSGMEDEALRSSGGNLSNMPVHMADMGSDVYEQDFTLGMAETERAIITEIDAALQRIEDKTFGICQMTGKPISKARLDAKPWAKYTIEAERIAESSGPR